MLIDELREQLKTIEPIIEALKSYWAQVKLGDRYAFLEKTVNDVDFWKHPEKDALLTEQKALRTLVEEYTQTIKNYEEEQELVELFHDDEAVLEKSKAVIFSLTKRVKKLKLLLLLQGEHDAHNCYVSINAGAGGTESQDWAEMLLRMYLRFCERHNFSVSVIDYQSGEGAGIKSATLEVRGSYAYGILKTENGIHRLVRISPFDANKRRHTSFAGVTVIPEVESTAVSINENDLRIDTYRAGGAGGQHVNKTDSAVRITHLPTNIVVQCQNERSQTQNKQTAMKLLLAKLMQKQEDEERARDSAVKREKIEWGSQIRSYVLHPYKMVKDHRTEHESPRPDDVLDGDLMGFIEAMLYGQGQGTVV